ncbi:MAG: FtsW/RodA/SpoVE family cell cycle protein [Planctomycetes bacterium]|nr:FtsW/RodA/SpoVE family cell cycle protein [Planctomycetota bacterium]
MTSLASRSTVRDALAARSERIRELDWIMLAVTVLCCLGIVMAVSVQAADPGTSALTAMRSQGTKLVIGLAAFLALAVVPLDVVRARAWLLYGVGVGLVLYAALFGPNWNGAHRWVSVAGYSFQPVDFARLALVVGTAAVVERTLRAGPHWRRGPLALLAALAPAGVLAAGLFLQPDKGNALLSLAIGASMVLAAGIGLWWAIGFFAALAPVLVVVVTRDHYAQDRISGWLTGDPPYQVAQSMRAFEVGSLTGEGIGAGWRKMGFVPEAQNDFVFSIIGEELGFVGSLLVVFAFMLIGAAGCRLCLRVRDPFLRYVVFGCTFALCTQALINLLVTTGAAPAKGIDLPFISSGGTNLMASLGAVGLMGNAARTDRRYG